MKMPKVKIKKEAVVSGGLVLLSIAQMALNSKKEANDKLALKNEITEAVMENLKNND